MRWKALRARREEPPTPHFHPDLLLKQRAEDLEQLFDEVRRLQRHINDCARRLHDHKAGDGASTES